MFYHSKATHTHTQNCIGANTNQIYPLHLAFTFLSNGSVETIKDLTKHIVCKNEYCYLESLGFSPFFTTFKFTKLFSFKRRNK